MLKAKVYVLPIIRTMTIGIMKARNARKGRNIGLELFRYATSGLEA